MSTETTRESAMSTDTSTTSTLDHVDAATYHSVVQFLYAESRLLDNRHFDSWVELFTDDARYIVPVRLNREDGADWESRSKAFDDTRQTLEIRVNRLNCEYAWAEQPPSRVRHYISNIEVGQSAIPTEVTVLANELIYRSRGNSTNIDLLSAQRKDTLRMTPDGWRIARRWTALDQSTLSAHNLSMFF